MNREDLVNAIISGIGGKDNVANVWHCSTRLRFNVRDDSKVNLDYLASLPEVLRAQFASGQLQVVIGPQVSDVYKILRKNIGDLDLGEKCEQQKKRVNILDFLIETLSGIFTPIIPAIAGVGMLKGIVALLTILKLVDPLSESYLILNIVADAGLYFIPFLLAVSTARKFNTSEYLALVLAGALMYPSLIELANIGETTAIKFFGIPIQILNYSNSVLPIILGVLLLRYVYDFLKKIIPKAITTVVTPTITLFIVIVASLAILAPLGQYAGYYFATFTAALFDKAGLLMGAVIGGTFAPLVITGMMYGYLPIMFENLSLYGYDKLLIPLSTVSNLAQAGATFGVAVKSKNKETKELAISSGITALLGITEPAMYGVTLKHKKPFIIALVASAISGSIVGGLGVRAYSLAGDSLLALPGFFTQDGYNNLLLMILAIVISFLIAFIGTIVIGFDEDIDIEKKEEVTKNNKYINIMAPTSGDVIKLSDVPDTVFSEKIAGEGLAINSLDGEIKAPFDGKVVSLIETNHAIGLVSKEGVEILIHIGLETINLKGEGFKCLVKENEEVKMGQKLIEFDKQFIESAGLYSSVIVVVTNANEFLDVLNTEQKYLQSKETALTIIR